MALIVEDGNGIAGADSYATEAQADLYHEHRGNTAWYSVADKEAALRKATDFMPVSYTHLAVNSNAGAGVSLQGVDANTTGNKITAVGGEGVLVSQAGAVVSGNRVTSGTQGVRVSASNVVVSGNRISGAQFWGVNVSAGAVDTLVIANNLAGNTSGAIFDLGTTTDAANNKPYFTHISAMINYPPTRHTVCLAKLASLMQGDRNIK